MRGCEFQSPAPGISWLNYSWSSNCPQRWNHQRTPDEETAVWIFAQMRYEVRNRRCEANLRRVHQQLRIRCVQKGLTLWLKLTEWHFSLHTKCLLEVILERDPLCTVHENLTFSALAAWIKPPQLFEWSVHGQAGLPTTPSTTKSMFMEAINTQCHS